MGRRESNRTRVCTANVRPSNRLEKSSVKDSWTLMFRTVQFECRRASSRKAVFRPVVMGGARWKGGIRKERKPFYRVDQLYPTAPSKASFENGGRVKYVVAIR